MTTSTDWTLVAFGLLAVALAVIIGYYVILRFRARGRTLKAELADSPLFAEDRAHNQIELIRGEISVLEREGIDTARARVLLQRAEQELARHENVDAVRSARDAHRILVELRQRGARFSPGTGIPSSPRAPPAPRVPARNDLLRPTPTRSGTGDLGAGNPAFEEAAPPSRPPKNRMEAHFEMTLLVEELTQQTPSRGATGAVAEAEGLRRGAQEAYARQDYTEALRLALRGRRRLGARIESLPPTAATVTVAAAALSPARAGGTTSTGPGQTPACATCGRPIGSTDAFCRGCGRPVGGSKCPRCGAERAATDEFCGRCGAPAEAT